MQRILQDRYTPRIEPADELYEGKEEVQHEAQEDIPLRLVMMVMVVMAVPVMTVAVPLPCLMLVAVLLAGTSSSLVLVATLVSVTVLSLMRVAMLLAGTSPALVLMMLPLGGLFADRVAHNAPMLDACC